MVPKPSKCGRVRSGAGLLRHGSRDYEIIEIASIVGFGGGKETSGPRPRGPNQHPGKAEESKSLAATGRRDSAGGVGLPVRPSGSAPACSVPACRKPLASYGFRSTSSFALSSLPWKLVCARSSERPARTSTSAAITGGRLLGCRDGRHHRPVPQYRGALRQAGEPAPPCGRRRSQMGGRRRGPCGQAQEEEEGRVCTTGSGICTTAASLAA